jgi:hypothetical protein
LEPSEQVVEEEVDQAQLVAVAVVVEVMDMCEAVVHQDRMELPTLVVVVVELVDGQFQVMADQVLLS